MEIRPSSSRCRTARPGFHLPPFHHKRLNRPPFSKRNWPMMPISPAFAMRVSPRTKSGSSPVSNIPLIALPPPKALACTTSPTCCTSVASVNTSKNRELSSCEECPPGSITTIAWPVLFARWEVTMHPAVPPPTTTIGSFGIIEVLSLPVTGFDSHRQGVRHRCSARDAIYFLEYELTR